MIEIKDLVIIIAKWPGWEYFQVYSFVFGIITIPFWLARFFHNKRVKKWQDNVRIDVYDDEEDIERDVKNAIYSSAIHEEGNSYSRWMVFKPNNCVIKKLFVYALDEEEKTADKIEKYYNLTPEDAVCFFLEPAEIFARYKIRWYGDFGEYAEYYFSENLRNGDNTIQGAVYKANMWTEIRKAVGWM